MKKLCDKNKQLIALLSLGCWGIEHNSQEQAKLLATEWSVAVEQFLKLHEGAVYHRIAPQVAETLTTLRTSQVQVICHLLLLIYLHSLNNLLWKPPRKRRMTIVLKLALQNEVDRQRKCNFQCAR